MAQGVSHLFPGSCDLSSSTFFTSIRYSTASLCSPFSPLSSALPTFFLTVFSALCCDDADPTLESLASDVVIGQGLGSWALETHLLLAALVLRVRLQARREVRLRPRKLPYIKVGCASELQEVELGGKALDEMPEVGYGRVVRVDGADPEGSGDALADERLRAATGGLVEGGVHLG